MAERKDMVIGAAVAGGALAAAKLGWDRLTGEDDPRRFALREDEPLREGIERIAVGRLDNSIEGLAGEGDADSATAIHEARKSIKRLRALLRRHANAQRKLRDSDAASEALRELRHARDRVAHWPVDGDSVASLAPGLERIYRRGRKAYRVARKNPRTENLHELRKRTKDLWYTGQIVQAASPKAMKKMVKGAHELSDLIGEEHDLALLAESALARPERFGEEASLEDLLDLIERRRGDLQRRALKVGARLYEKKPGKLARKLEDAS